MISFCMLFGEKKWTWFCLGMPMLLPSFCPANRLINKEGPTTIFKTFTDFFQNFSVITSYRYWLSEALEISKKIPKWMELKGRVKIWPKQIHLTTGTVLCQFAFRELKAVSVTPSLKHSKWNSCVPCKYCLLLECFGIAKIFLSGNWII